MNIKFKDKHEEWLWMKIVGSLTRRVGDKMVCRGLDLADDIVLARRNRLESWNG